jgi:two-component system chemotaxis sensor kinase CheA
LAADDRFLAMFYEEARELLISLEEGLMELERRQGDRAHLDKTFRAAHSMKGAASMVGLLDLAEFTHGIEAVLDHIRAGTLTVDSDIITTLLEARDHLAAMVEAEAARAPIPPSRVLQDRLAVLLHGSARSGAPPTEAPPPTPPPVETAGPAARAEEVAAEPPAPVPPPRTPRKRTAPDRAGARARPRTPRGKAKPETPPVQPTPDVSLYRILFKPGPDTLRRGANPLGVLDELRELGRTEVSTEPERVPPLEELDPERCYLTWKIEVETSAGPDRLDDVFLFVAADSTITIERRASDGTILPLPSLSAPAQAPDAEGSLGPSPGPALHPPELVEAPPPPHPATIPMPAAPAQAPAPEVVAVAVRSTPTTSAPPPPAFRIAPRIRVDASQLDDLVGLAGELAVISDNLQRLREIPGATPWVHALESLERVSRQVRDTTLDLRMVAVDELFSRFPRVVRDLADRHEKEIELQIVGQETRLDRTIVERLSEPMIHLIRNAVDHALESPAERLALGKPRAGRIRLMAGHEGDRVAIRVEDDGRGLDREQIVRKGIARGLVPAGTPSDDARVDTLIFEAGFSTRDQVSELSGRGVGLDVVRDAVRALRGTVAVESVPGKGTAFIFRLPLTLALIDGLLVEMAGNRYVVPLAQVEECVALNGSKPALAKGRPCVAVRGELVPMVPLRKLFHADGDPPARQELLLTRHAGQRVGVAVDKLLGRVQAVIQALGEGLSGMNRFSGATILGDGTVSLILDLGALVTESRTAGNHSQAPGVLRAEGF